MADLTISSCTIVKEYDGDDLPAGEDLNAGQYARLDASTGKAVLGNASSAGEVGTINGLVTGQDADTGQSAHVVYDGLLDVGDALDALNFMDEVYLSNTDGTLASTAGTVSTVKGYVVPGWAYTSADKLLRLIPWHSTL